MFRKMRRFKQQVPEETCIQILKEEPRGVLSVHGEDGYPYAFPMDFFYYEETGKIYFHCAREGHKLDAIRKNEKVCFCVYNSGYRKEGEWALNITSLVIFGRIREMEDRDEMKDRILELTRKYYPDEESAVKEVEKDFHRVAMLELTIDHMTGKLVNES